MGVIRWVVRAGYLDVSGSIAALALSWRAPRRCPMPSTASEACARTNDACKGVIRLLVAEHGPEVVEVHRKEPVQPWMLHAWLSLPDGTRVGPYVVGDKGV